MQVESDERTEGEWRMQGTRHSLSVVAKTVGTAEVAAWKAAALAPASLTLAEVNRTKRGGCAAASGSERCHVAMISEW
eukprot:scaffold14091_cov28-Tisochrysis_lutea.AAC.4